MANTLTIGYLLLLVVATAGLVVREGVQRRRREPFERIHAAVKLGLREIDAIAAITLQQLRTRAEQPTDLRDTWERW